MNKKILANIFLFLTAIIWGFAFVAQVLGSDVIDPFSFNAIRFGLGALSLVPVIFLLEKRPRNPLTAEQRSDDNKKLKMTLIAAAVCGTILFAASTLQQVGAQITKSPGRSGFLTDLYTILTPLFALIFFKRKIQPTVFVGAGLACVGLYLLCIKPEEGFGFGWGEAVIVIGAIFWAFHILAIDRFGNQIYPLRFSCLQFAVVSAESAVFALMFEHTTLQMVWEARWAIIFCGVFSVGIAYTLQTYGQRLSDPSYAAIIFSLEAVFGAIGGVIFGQDHFSAAGIFGCVLIFAGIVLAQLNLSKKKSPKAAENA